MKMTKTSALLLALIIVSASFYGFYKIYDFAIVKNCMEVEEIIK